MDSEGGFFFINLVPQARKRNTIIPEDTLLKNRNLIEYSFVRTVGRPDRKRGKLPLDRHVFKFQVNEHERPRDCLAIFS